MAIVNRHIETHSPYMGLGPGVLHVPMYWYGYPKAAASNNVATKTQHTTGSSIAAGTALDYPRNVVVYITPSASSAGVTGGGVTIYGRDLYGSTRSETFNSLAATSSVGQTGSVNFAVIDTISMKLSFLPATASAASDFGVFVGAGLKLGLPVSIRETNAVFEVVQGTAHQWQYTGATSSNNEWTVVTGDYWNGGIKLSSALNSGSLHAIGYMGCGRIGKGEYFQP